MAANDDIRDALTRRQIRVSRMAAGLGRRLTRILDLAEADLQRDILRRLDPLAQPRVKFGSTTTERLQRMQRAIARLNGETHQAIRDATREDLLQLAKDEAIATAAAIENNMPVLISLDLPESNLLRTLVLSRPFQGKNLNRWLSDLETGDRRRMMDAVRIGLLRGESSVQIGRRVFGTARLGRTDGARAITRRGAQGIANTAVSHVTNSARQALYLANRSLIPQEVYVATLDSRTTPICRSLDGNVFNVGEGPVPPVHFNCRSTRVPAIDGALAGTRPANAATRRLLEGTRGAERRALVERLVGPVPAATTYQEFLRAQTVDFQEEVLGVTKARLFRQGRLPLDRFVDSRGKELTLAQLRRLEPEAFSRAGLTE